MAYDVFLVSAPEDMDMANLVARRLRAMKFKVRFDKNRKDETFDDKDARDALKAQSMLVLWSEHAVKSDWVRAAASVGHSRPGVLVQVGLDETIPYEPFRLDKRYDLAGFTSRTNVEGWYQTVEELGRRDGRKNLRQWMDIPSKDEEARTVWLGRHPTDPLAMNALALRDKKSTVAPAPAAGASGAAVLAASAIGASRPASASQMDKPFASLVTAPGEDEGAFSFIPLLIMLGIGLLFLFGWLNASKPLPRAGFVPTQLAATCPAGLVPRSLIASETLETGQIQNDTDQ